MLETSSYYLSSSFFNSVRISYTFMQKPKKISAQMRNLCSL